MVQPQAWLGFIETKPFSRLWQKLQLTDADLLAVQLAILSAPKGFPLISGTGGVRKLRFARSTSSQGKSGGLRVCYAYFEKHQRVVLLLVYPKNVQENLTEAEKQHLRAALARIEQELDAPAT